MSSSVSLPASPSGVWWPRWIVGVFVGLLLSAPSAVITKAWGPILGIGAIGGLIIALIMPHVVR